VLVSRSVNDSVTLPNERVADPLMVRDRDTRPPSNVTVTTAECVGCVMVAVYDKVLDEATVLLPSVSVEVPAEPVCSSEDDSVPVFTAAVQLTDLVQVIA
jgi:hypothetical protein